MIHPETVLVVEDEDVVRRVILAALRTAGYRTLEAFDGACGLTTFANHKDEIDLVITDVLMPHSGPEMVKNILQVNPLVPVGIVTGTPEHEALPTGMRRMPVLRKPFSVQQLLAFVRECIDAREASTVPDMRDNVS